MRCTFLLCALALTACQSTAPGTATAPADSAAGEIAFELASPGDAAILVPVTVNGRGPYQFVLDTGATLTCIDQALADSLQLADLPGAIGVGAGVGGGGRMRLVKYDSLSVGNASVTDLPGCAIDLSHVQELGFAADGLLGLNFLKPFRMTLDFERNVLRLEDPG